MKFDEMEFKVLLVAHPSGFGYYANEPYRSRVLDLMEEGIITPLPEAEWFKSGYKLSDKGMRYYDDFMSKARARHKHVWRLDDDGEIDISAYADHYCNGPECEVCGFYFCHHCTTEFSVPVCGGKQYRVDRLKADILSAEKDMDSMRNELSRLENNR